MSMHLDKTVLTPLRGDIKERSRSRGLCKRPLFFPFLTSLVHDVTGYRPANAFGLNAGLTFLLLGLACMLGRLLAGRVAGWLAVVLLAGLPLLAHNATGGGFELLNLVMILATMLLGVRAVEKRDAPAITAFCFAGLLLAQVRYESVIYLGPVGLVVLWVWWREGRAVLSWPVIVAPLLMATGVFHLQLAASTAKQRVGMAKLIAAAVVTIATKNLLLVLCAAVAFEWIERRNHDPASGSTEYS